MAVFYWVGGYTGSTGTESGYHITGNYWTNWVTGLTSTVGDVFYSPYAWNVRENWRLEHTGQVQPSDPNVRVVRDSVPTRLPKGGDDVIIGGIAAYLGTGPYGGGPSGGSAGSLVYVANIAPHNFSLLFGGMSGDGYQSSGLTAWKEGGSTKLAQFTVKETFTSLNKTWGNVASTWAGATAVGLSGTPIRTGEIGSWGLKNLWGSNTQSLSGAALGNALTLANLPLNLILPDVSSCFVNRKQSSLSATGGATIHIKSKNFDAGFTGATIKMIGRDGSGYTASVYGTYETPAINHFLIPKGQWTLVEQFCGNTQLEDGIVADTVYHGRALANAQAAGYFSSDRTANVNTYRFEPGWVYGSNGKNGINIECYEQSAVPEIVSLGWKNQSPTNCLTIGNLGGISRTVSKLQTVHSSTIPNGTNPRSAAGLSAADFWRVDLPWAISNWWTGPIVVVRNCTFTEILHEGGVMLVDPESSLNDYFIIQNGYVESPAQIIGKNFNNPAWKNFLIGYIPSDKGVTPFFIPRSRLPGSLNAYIKPNLIIPYDGQGTMFYQE